MNRSRVHLIYPSGPSIACPHAIGRHLSDRLSRRWDVDLRDWDEIGALRPSPDAVLLGHPHPNPLSVFRRSAAKPGWRRVIMLNPFNADPRQVAWLAPLVERLDAYLAITGPYWFDVLDSTPFARWKPRMERIDLAVDRREYPRVKHGFAPPGQRRFLYIGQSGWPKNTAFLSRLAQALPETSFSWLGTGTEEVPGVRALGRKDFSDPEIQSLLAEYDFMITVGTADANPATVLEAMAWGLVPVCSPQSGYVDIEGIVNVPIDNLERACGVIQELQEIPETTLREWVVRNDERLDRHYNWDRFADQVEHAMEQSDRPALPPVSLGLRARLAWYTWVIGPHRPWRPAWLAAALRSLRRR